MKRLLAAVLLALALPAAAAWVAPANPDPQKILQEALEDRMAGRYEDALAKQEWFHREALRYRRSLHGVRLSFALAYWADLAELYAPAKVSLLRVRDEAAQAVRDGRSAQDNFEDFAAINRELDDPLATVSLFLEIDKRDPKAAKEMAATAFEPLMDGKYYEVAARYVDPKTDMAQAIENYKFMKARPPAAKGVDFDALTEGFFANRAGRLVALMVLVNRRPEAEKLAQEALATSDSAKVKETIDAALAGQVPPSFLNPKARRGSATPPAPTAASPAAPK